MQSRADLFPRGPHCWSVLRPEAGHATDRQEGQEGKGSVFLLPGVTPGFLLYVSSSDEFTVEMAKWNEVEGFLQGLGRDSGLASAFSP